MPSLAFPLICALLRGESPAWPADAGDTAIEAFLRDGDSALLVPPDDPEALADIREADAEYLAGNVVRGVEAARALRP